MSFVFKWFSQRTHERDGEEPAQTAEAGRLDSDVLYRAHQIAHDYEIADDERLVQHDGELGVVEDRQKSRKPHDPQCLTAPVDIRHDEKSHFRQ